MHAWRVNFGIYPMKKLLLLSSLTLTSGLCLAQEIGRVISSTPVMQQVGVPRNVCTTEQVAVQRSKSGAGALMGAIAGGAMGNAIGGGNGKAAATVIGLFGGAILGDQVEGAPPAQFQNVQRCTTQTYYENRPVAYNVVYDYAGQQYEVQMSHDPGSTIALQVSPVGSNAPTTGTRGRQTYQQQPVYEQPVYAQPPVIVVSPPVYSGYDSRRYAPPMAIELNYQNRREHDNRHRNDFRNDQREDFQDRRYGR